jgi:hypothetical protein
MQSSALAAEVELLELRALLSGVAPQATSAPDLIRMVNAGSLQPQNTAGPTGYTPAEIKQAYGFNQISFSGVAGDGTGTTIAIVDAFDDPNITNDLHQFDLAYGLPDPPSFIKLNETGGTTNLPKANSGWITEIALDVEWTHAIAPGAKIVLVEAKSASDSDLMTAVNTARSYSGVDVVSMSWGGSEDSSELAEDSTFTTPAGHTGVTFVASSGDDGAPDSYPSASSNVVSVGGTTLHLDASGNILSETAWSGSGGGISTVESQPAYQKGVVTQSSTFRTNPDVSYDADPNTGFGVYDSYNNGTKKPWGQWGGTSDAAPQWAALIAIADQGRILAGKGTLDGPTQTLPMLYSLSSSDFHDITSGSSSGSPSYSAGTGYDLVTGRGTPYANRVVNDLVGSSATVVVPPAPPTLTSIATLGVASPQTPFDISYATLLAASNAVDSNGQSIQFRINSLQSGTLSIIHNSVVSTVIADPTNGTLFGVGDTLIWTGPAGVTGNAIGAFSVTAFDGTTNSAAAVPVSINVSSLGTQFDVSGSWLVVNSSGATAGLGSIVQTGANLAFVNAQGGSSSGQFISASQIAATNLNGTGSMLGTIDLSTADQGRIAWSDGSVWLKVSLGGQWTVAGGVTTTLASITQAGNLVTLINGASATIATIGYNSTLGQVQLQLSNNTSIALTDDSFTLNGQVWTKLDLPTNYTSSWGGSASVVQNGTASLMFVNSQGQTSPGFWTSPNQVVATAFGNEVGTVGNGAITWSTGEVWSENVALNGNKVGTFGAVSIAATPSLAVLSNQYSVTSYVNSANSSLTEYMIQNGSATALFINDSGSMALGTLTNNGTQASIAAWGAVATIGAGTINFSNGLSWTQSVLGFTSPLTITSYVNLGDTSRRYLVQNGTSTVAILNASMVLGTVLNSTQFAIPSAGLTATLGPGQISFSNNSSWMQTTLVPNVVTASYYICLANGNQGQVITNGTSVLFIKSDGSAAFATLVSGTTYNIAAWNLQVTIGTGQITFGNGSFWTQISGPQPNVSLTDTNGAAFKVQFTTPTTFVALQGTLAGITGTWQNGAIVWSNGTIWNDFDFNALNALFEMSTGYP